MLSLLFAASLVAASPEWHYPRQVANSSITASGAAVTGTAVHNCSWTWSDYLSSSHAVQYTNFTNITSTYTYYNLTASVTTECDGVTRIVGDLTTIATGTNTTFTSTSHNYTGAPAPTCTPSPDDCKTLDILYGTYPCPRPTTSVSQQCGQCSIFGGTVDLIYFPITTSTTAHDLCPNATTSPGTPTICPLGPTTASRNATNPYDYQPCYYATGNATSTTNSGPYVLSGGHTFYQNRAYISMQTAYASDQCGFIGEQYTGTILEVKSEQVYSVGGYHHEFQDAGYQFNFQDLEAVPSYAYYLDCNAGGPASCDYQGTRYRYGTDFINGKSDIDLGRAGVASTDNYWIFQEAYTPMLLLPTQIRDLDPAWASCSLNLGGLYDPPKALTQAPEQPGPTAPSDPGDGMTTAEPGNGPTTSGPTPTALPVTTTPTTTPPDSEPTDTPDEPSDGGDDDEPEPTTPSEPAEPTGGDDDGEDAPAPTTPSEPEPTGGDDDDAPVPAPTGGNDDGDDDSNPTTPSNPTPTNSGGDTSDDGDDDGENGGGNNGGGSDNSDDDTPAPVTTPDVGGAVISAIQLTASTQNVGGVIASIIGVTNTNNGNGQATPTPAEGNSSGNDDDDAAQPAPAPVTFTADDGSAQTVAAVQGTSEMFVVGTQTVTAGGSAIEVYGVTVSAGSFGQIVAGSQTLVADISAQTPAAIVGSDGSTLEVSTISSGPSGVFVVDDATLSAGGSAATVNGVTLTAGPSGVVDVNAAAAVPTGSDGEAIAVSTITAGSSGVYVADGTTLSVGGDEQFVNGATLSAAPTGVVDVNEDDSSPTDSGSSDGASESGSTSAEPSTTSSGSGAQQTTNTAASLLSSTWLSSGIAGAFAMVVALL